MCEGTRDNKTHGSDHIDGLELDNFSDQQKKEG